jgi:hypothetical protein
VDVHSIEIESEATHLVGLTRFTVRDHSGTVSIAAKDAVSIAAGGANLFAGEVAEQAPQADGVSVVWTVTCQDNNILLDERTIQGAQVNAGLADSAIIHTLFDMYRSDIDSTTYVETIDASMEALEFAAMTLREIMDDICSRTGGRYYVDADMRLHYFSSEANAAAFGLSTSPNGSTSFPLGDFKRAESASRIVNRVFVQGKGVWGWVEDAASIAVYGQRHGVSRDQRITTSQGVQDRGNAILAQYAWPRNTYTCWTEKDGLAAGQEIAIEHETLGVDDSFYIRSITTRFLGKGGGKRRYYLTLNDEPIKPEVARRNVNLRIMALETVVNDVNGTVYDTDAPATPTFVAGNLTTGVDVDADGHQLVYVQATWGSVADADLSYYQIQVSTSSDFAGYTITRSHPADGDRLERFVPVLGNTTYYARVRAIDWVGNASAWSDTRSITTSKDTSAPAQVAGLSAAGSRTLMGLKWTANSEADLAEYEIARAPDSGGAPGVWAIIATTGRLNFYVDQEFSDAQIKAEGTWWYRVRAVDTSRNAGAWSTADSAALSQIASDHIAAAAITAVHVGANEIITNSANIKNATITSAKIVNLDGIVITGNTIRTAASGARIVLDSTDGIQAYNAGGVQTVSILPSGAGWIGIGDQIAWNTAGGLTVDGGVLVDGTVVATAFSNAIGQPLFSAADGLALWGPGCEIGPTSWLSTRGQTATISGAFHQEQGAWLGTRGLVVERGTVNMVRNPSAAVNVTDYWGFTRGTRARDTTYYKFDGASFALTGNGTAGGPYIYKANAVVNPVQGVVYSLSAWFLGTAETDGTTAYVAIQEQGGAAPTAATYTYHTLTRGWQWVTVTRTVAEADRTSLLLAVGSTDSVNGHTTYIDGIQFELGNPTSTCIGSMAHCTWGAGTPHVDAVSNREGNIVSVPLPGTINAAAGSIVVNFKQLTWSYVGGFLFRAGNANAEFDAFINSTGTLIYRINGSNRLTTTNVAAGQEHQVVFTWDVATDTSQMYLDGVQVGGGNGTCGGGAWTPDTVMYIGSIAASSGYALGGTVSQFATLGRVLTADEIAALYITGKPLVDAGAVDVPGVYIYDGKFLVANRATGIRQVLAPTYLSIGSDPTFSSGTGIWLGLDGETPKFRIGTTAGNRISWDGSTLTVVGSITITGGSGIANLTDAGACATADTIDEVPEGDTYGRVRQTDLSGGHLKLSSYTVIDGEWYDRAGVEIDANTGINIYGKENALTTRATKTGTIQCYVGADGAIYAGGGGIKMSSAANLLFSINSQSRGISWFSDTGFSTVSGYIGVAKTSGVMTIATGGPSWGTAPDMRFDLVSSAGGGSTWTAIYIDASDVEVRINGASGGSLSCRNNNDGAWPAFYAHQNYQVNRAVAHFDQDHESAPIIRLDGPWSAATEKSLGGYFKANINGTDRWIPYYV